MSVVAVVTAAALALAGCSADGINGAAAAQAESTHPVETRTVQANTFDLEFIDQIRPLLQDTVELGEQLLASEGIEPAVRDLAQTSVSRQQDEIIQLNSLLEQWGAIGEATEGVTESLPKVTSETQVEPGADLLSVPEDRRSERYLDTLRDRLEMMVTLAEEEIAQGESAQLKDQAELMVRLKTKRIGQILELS